MTKHGQVAIRTGKTNEQLLAEGTNEAMEELARRIGPWIRATARRGAGALGLYDWVDDLIGETLVIVVKSGGQCVHSVFGFFHTVILNLAATERRRRRRKPVDPLGEELSGTEEDDDDRVFNSGAGGKSGSATELERRVTFWDGFDYYFTRQPRRAAIFYKYYVEGETTRELANEYKTTVDAIQRELSRARGDLRGIFAPAEVRCAGARPPAAAP